MEQKAKRIGKLNIIDLIAIVLIVAVLDANGNWVTDPDHVTLIFTVTTTTPTAEVMTTKVGDQEVRIGKTDYILKSEYIEFSDGTITNVIWGD